MKRILVATAVVACAAAVSAAGWRAAGALQGAPAAGAKPAQGASASAPAATIARGVKRPPGLRGDVQRQLDDAEQKLIQLASVMPPDKFAWRPVPGVRSFGEVCLHVAGGNYEVGSMWGMKTPPTVDLAKIEQQGADKGNAIAAMRVSFEQVRQSIAAMPDSDVDKWITYFGHPGTVRWALIEVAVHAHEHLGQAIVYARMNGIVPPWTAAANSPPAAKPAPPKATGR
ncbi:MAG TPA: DinB family protein [Thermoanaerobaculia bacterium]|nr:DinB family protein [Thermoanaerobaculia bacterium]